MVDEHRNPSPKVKSGSRRYASRLKMNPLSSELSFHMECFKLH